jgi:hypothetical protein
MQQLEEKPKLLKKKGYHARTKLVFPLVIFVRCQWISVQGIKTSHLIAKIQGPYKNQKITI